MKKLFSKLFKKKVELKRMYYTDNNLFGEYHFRKDVYDKIQPMIKELPVLEDIMYITVIPKTLQALCILTDAVIAIQ